MVKVVEMIMLKIVLLLITGSVAFVISTPRNVT